MDVDVERLIRVLQIFAQLNLVLGRMRNVHASTIRAQELS